MEIVDFMVNHVYPFLGSRDHLGSIFWQNQVEANEANKFFIYISVRRTVIELQPFVSLVIRTPPSHASRVIHGHS